jgi:hypothetical protein
VRLEANPICPKEYLSDGQFGKQFHRPSPRRFDPHHDGLTKFDNLLHSNHDYLALTRHLNDHSLSKARPLPCQCEAHKAK